MRRLIIVWTVLVLSLVYPLASDEGAYSRSVSAQPPVQPNRVTHTSWTYRGTVAKLGPDWVELAPGWAGTIEEDLATGRKWVRENGDTKKPKRVSSAGTKPGGNQQGEGEDFTHWVSDLKVGDVVSMDTHANRAGDEWTTRIWIRRRPGGKIPPLHGEVVLPGEKPTLHLRFQAEQDWEEKGVPIPKKYLDKNGRAPWTNPPYPPVAPMPRPAKR